MAVWVFVFCFCLFTCQRLAKKKQTKEAAGTSQAVKTTVLLHRYKQLFVYYYYIFSISLTKLCLVVLLCDLIALSEGIFKHKMLLA